MKQKLDTILEIHDLSVSFTQYNKLLEQETLPVISNLHLKVYPGEIVAVVGSSGSGKSILASAILGILPDNAIVNGHLHYKGRELNETYQNQLRGHEFAFVPQSVDYLDPLMRVGQQVDGHNKDYLKHNKESIFTRLDLPKSTEDLFPFQLSGGMARRTLISTAIITDANLIIADEPTPGMSLDQALEALKMFREFADDGKSVILITHDLDLACKFADRIAVFYAGTTIETALADDFNRGRDFLRHPYTKALYDALPQNSFKPISGFQPYAGIVRKGCPFAPRCPLKTLKCQEEFPSNREIRNGEVRCFHAT